MEVLPRQRRTRLHQKPPLDQRNRRRCALADDAPRADGRRGATVRLPVMVHRSVAGATLGQRQHAGEQAVAVVVAGRDALRRKRSSTRGETHAHCDGATVLGVGVGELMRMMGIYIVNRVYHAKCC